MWRAAICMAALNHPGLELFQYRERYVEGCNLSPQGFTVTEVDGFQYRERYVEGCNMNNAGDKNIRSVSIPRTVCGGLQLQIAERFDNPNGVSIPRTVCGGLQYKVYMIFYLK